MLFKTKNNIHSGFKFAILFVAIIIVIVSVNFLTPKVKTAISFPEQKTPLTETYDLWDVGIVDANNDQNLDIFTVNHSGRQNLLIGSSSGDWTDVLSEWGLDQDRDFPGLEDTDKEPLIDSPGLYIYRKNFDLYVRTFGIQDSNQLVKGTIKLSLPVTLKKQDNVEVKIEEDSLPSGATQTTVNFTAQNTGLMVLEGYAEIPHRVHLENNFPLEQVYLGIQKQQPQSEDFTLMWRDRHTMAWADFNGDGDQDIFIGRGGIRGKMKALPEKFTDELFVASNTKPLDFQDTATQLGLVKNACPVRQSAWVDINNDSRLDLYVVCGRIVQDPGQYPSQLYRQNAEGQFVDIAEEVGLDLPKSGHVWWLDSDDDGDMDLLTSQEENFLLYENQLNQSGKFELSLTEKLDSTITKFAVSDFDLDGDQDIYLVTKTLNRILINKDGIYVQEDPQLIGLPTQGLTANWVDYDNDGLVDLHVVPSGLYHQKPNHQFEETKLLNIEFPTFTTWDALSAWFDADNNGTRDLLLAYKQRPALFQENPPLKERILNQLLKRKTSRIWQSQFYLNRKQDNHWIELELIGSPGNPQAIGAKVEVRDAEKSQFQLVGSSENSHYSQGHYRLYFGLGKQEKPDLIRVRWPDGNVQEIQAVEGDRLLIIRKEVIGTST
ncbi:MAG: CRTAC1 family protein [Cyanobacteria bacterium J06592_8]